MLSSQSTPYGVGVFGILSTVYELRHTEAGHGSNRSGQCRRRCRSQRKLTTIYVPETDTIYKPGKARTCS